MLHRLPDGVVQQIMAEHVGYLRCVLVGRTCRHLRQCLQRVCVRLNSVRLIRRFWRQSVPWDRVVDAFRECIRNCRQLDDLFSSAALDAGQKICARLCSLAKYRGPPVDPRDILVAYGFVHAPNYVFLGSLGPPEHALIDVAKAMIKTLAPPRLQMAREFVYRLEIYTTAFQNWRNPGHDQLVQRIARLLIMLYAYGNRANHPPESEVWVQLRKAIRARKEKLASMSPAVLARVEAALQARYVRW